MGNYLQHEKVRFLDSMSVRPYASIQIGAILPKLYKFSKVCISAYLSEKVYFLTLRLRQVFYYNFLSDATDFFDFSGSLVK